MTGPKTLYLSSLTGLFILEHRVLYMNQSERSTENTSALVTSSGSHVLSIDNRLSINDHKHKIVTIERRIGIIKCHE